MAFYIELTLIYFLLGTNNKYLSDIIKKRDAKASLFFVIGAIVIIVTIVIIVAI